MKKLLIALFAMLCVAGVQAQHTSFEPYVATPVGSFFEFVVSADIDADGDQDIIGATSSYFDPLNDFSVFVWENNAGLQLQAPNKFRYTASNQIARAIAAGDLNADGKDEIAIAYGDSVCVFENTPSGWVRVFNTYTGQTANGVDFGDIDNDGELDIAVSHWNSTWISVLYGAGVTNAFGQVQYTIPNVGLKQILVERIGNNAFESIVYMRESNQQDKIQVITMFLNRTIATNTAMNLPVFNGWGFPHGIAVGDRYGSGFNQLACTWGGNAPNCGVVVWDSCSSNATYTNIPTLDVPEPVRFANVDCAAGDEIIVAHGGWVNVSVINDTVVRTQVPYASHYKPTGITTGDWNNDGKQDVALADYNNGLVILYNNTACIVATEVVNESIISNINVYPNPTTGIFQVEGGTIGEQIVVIDMFGQTIWSGQILDNTTTIDLLDITPGMYIVQTGQISKKIIISRP